MEAWPAKSFKNPYIKIMYYETKDPQVLPLLSEEEAAVAEEEVAESVEEGGEESSEEEAAPEAEAEVASE